MSDKYRLDLDISGKVPVLTGAGEGVGRAIARTFASRGTAIVVSDLTKARSEAQEIRASGGCAISVKAYVLYRSSDWGEPAEIGAGMLFLASGVASYITGQTIIIDGGALLPETMAG